MDKNSTNIIEDNYVEILNAIPIASVCIGYDQTIKYINKKFIDLFGYTISDIPTSYDWFRKAYPNEKYRNEIINDWQNDFNDFKNKQRTPKPYEVKVVCKNNKIVYIEINTNLLHECILCTFTDITQHKINQEILLNNRKLLDRAQQITRIGYWEIYLNTNKLNASQQAKDIYGIPLELELTYNDIKNIPLPEYRDMLDDKLKKLIKNNETYDVFFQICRENDKSIIDIHSIAEFNQLENKIFGVIQDITKIKKTEKEIIKNQEQINDILNASPIAIVSFNKDYNLTFYNKKSNELLGYSEADISNIYDWLILAYPETEYRNEIIRNWNYSIQLSIENNSEIDSIEAYAKCKDGTIRYLQFNTNILTDLILISIVDLTEHKKTMDLIVENDTKYRALFENSTDAISITRNGLNEYVNSAYLTMFGYEDINELLNLNPDYLIAEESINMVKKYTESRLNGEEAPIYYEAKGIKKDGTIFDASIKVSSYKLNNEQYMLIIIRDITERIILTEALIKEKEKAEESEKLKSAFLTNMSHEIRTPMNAIMGFSELLCDPDLDDDQKKQYSDIIHKRSDDLLVIVNDILDYSKIDSNQISLHYSEGDFQCLFVDIVNFFESKSLIERDNITIKSIYDLSKEESYIKSDFGKIKQILINLLSNAFKFTKAGIIEVGCKLTDNNMIMIYVKDNGIGIPEDKIEIIFERFRQVDNSNTRQYGGTGLGLSISRGLVKLFNGDIWVETEVNKGSTFYFTIPYQPVLKFEKEMKITSNQMYNWENKKILITEDDEFNALYITEILASTKINILIANSGKEALDLFNKNNDIDIVLMDVMLPDINGINLTKELKKIKNNQIIIAQTAFYSCDDKNECINAGCKDFISKPINKTVLLNLLNGHLSN